MALITLDEAKAYLRGDADILLMPDGGRSLICMGRVMIHTLPLPGKV